MELKLDSSIPGGAQPGDVIWVSRRKKIPEVSPPLGDGLQGTSRWKCAEALFRADGPT